MNSLSAGEKEGAESDPEQSLEYIVGHHHLANIHSIHGLCNNTITGPQACTTVLFLVVVGVLTIWLISNLLLNF